MVDLALDWFVYHRAISLNMRYLLLNPSDFSVVWDGGKIRMGKEKPRRSGVGGLGYSLKLPRRFVERGGDESSIDERVHVEPRIGVFSRKYVATFPMHGPVSDFFYHVRMDNITQGQA